MSENKYCIIGAGPAGLATARQFLRNKIPYDQFDRHSDVGGVWDIKSASSTMYKSAHLISSKKSTEFTDFPMPEGTADYPHHSVVLKYFRDFAREFELYPQITFNTGVKRIAPVENGWSVTLDTGETRRYRGVAIANGHLNEPKMPEFAGTFDGETFHTAKYKTADVFEKKRVLVVGAGNSGCDIACDALHRATRTFISMRRGYHIVPKFLFGMPAADVGGSSSRLLPIGLKRKVDEIILKMFVGNPQKYGVPAPDHKLYESHPIVNSQLMYHLAHGDISVKPNVKELRGKTVLFDDGSEEEIDTLVYATGYRLTFPFVDKELLNWNGYAPKLYLNIFHPRYDNLFVMGMIESDGGGWQIRDWQAEMVARFIQAQEHTPQKAERFRKMKAGPPPDTSGGVDYMKVDRMAYYVRNYTYKEMIQKAIRTFE